MIIGIPKELKDNEFRVSTTPAGVKALSEAGLGSFITNKQINIISIRLTISHHIKKK